MIRNILGISQSTGEFSPRIRKQFLTMKSSRASGGESSGRAHQLCHLKLHKTKYLWCTG